MSLNWKSTFAKTHAKCADILITGENISLYISSAAGVIAAPLILPEVINP